MCWQRVHACNQTAVCTCCVLPVSNLPVLQLYNSTIQERNFMGSMFALPVQRAMTVQALCHMGTQCGEVNLLLKAICECWDAPTACVTLLGSDHVWMCNAASADGSTVDPKCVEWGVAMCVCVYACIPYCLILLPLVHLQF
jgi:hypothetical protein